MPRPSRRSLLRGAALAAGAGMTTAGLGACSLLRGDGTVRTVGDVPSSNVLPAEDASAGTLALSAALLAAADVVVLADEASAPTLAALTGPAGIPLLIGTGEAVTAELDRLGAGTIGAPAGLDTGSLAEGRTLHKIDLAAEHPLEDLPTPRLEQPLEGLTVFVDPEQSPALAAAAGALARTAGARTIRTPGGDPGRSAQSVAAVKEAAGEDPSTGMVALGPGFGAADAWEARLQRVLTVPELPGGGQTVFPGRRMVAAYGTPGVPSLGILGEQDVQASITRVQELTAQYQALTDEVVVPAFEIIATLASSQPGADGDYSRELGIDGLREWVDAAGEAGMYVVLDLQPGTESFPSQAKLVEELLTAPHVGLALDAEWRLEPGQKHLEQIGSVSAAEVNETAQWLAELTARHDLPQKAFVLHQFTRSMITDRQDLDTSHPELAMIVHADGAGAPDDKLTTWRALQKDLPAGIVMAWKNFYDEDAPMFTPEQTYDVEPRPWFVSYQ